MNLLTNDQKKRLKRIIDAEGKLIDFMENNSAIITIEIYGKKYKAFHVQLLEIFSDNTYPIGQSLKLNKKHLLKLNCKEEQIKDLILVIIGENYDDEKVTSIWDGTGIIPWKISKCIVTEKLTNKLNETTEEIQNILNRIKYYPQKI